MKITLISILCFFSILVSAQKGKLFTPVHGLSNTSFYSITQEKEGLVWIATENGLNKFDGFNFTSYFNNPSDTNSVNSNFISSIFVDSDNKLWIGTNTNLGFYNREKDNFSVFRLVYRNREFTPEITSICEDNYKNLWITSSIGLIRIDLRTSQTYFCNINDGNYLNFSRDLYNTSIVDDKGNVWVGTDEHGLLMFNQKTGKFKTFCEAVPPVLCNGSILSLGKDKTGNIYIGTLNEGLFVFRSNDHLFKYIASAPDPDNTYAGAIYSIAADKNDRIWVGTERNGIKVLNPEKNLLVDANYIVNGTNIRDNKVHCFPDKDGNLWLCIDYVGVYFKNLYPRPFYAINKNNPSPWHINHDIVKSIYLNKDKLWIGTDGGGLTSINLSTNQSRVFKNVQNNSKSIPDNAVIAIAADKDNDLWIGTYLGGLSLYNPENESFRTYLIDPSNRNRSINYVMTITPDSTGNLWVGTNGGGLWYFNKKQEKFYSRQTIFLNRQRIQTPAFITAFLTDKEKTMWIGSYNGLYALNETTGTYMAFTKENSNITDDAILALHEDNKDNIWFGTRKGLYRLNKKNQTLKGYYTDNGLSNNSISGILEDKHGNLWISTLNGINKMVVDREEFSNFSVYDGLPGNEFRPSACFNAPNGYLYFGSTSGLVFFNPDSIKDSKSKPQLIFTKLRLFNEEVKAGEKINRHIILKEPINYTKEITFSYSENSFTIEFAAVSYFAPEKIRYAYMMEGFDQKLTVKDYTQRYATYTNLDPGTYVFKLKNTNIDGVWDENFKTLIIHIRPPFYKTWWAYCCYFILLLGVLIITRRLTLFRINMQNRLEMERLEREKLEELNQSKLNFFSNVSHEFRTPLTLIMGPLERLKNSGLEKNVKYQIDMVYRNAQRLLRLVNLLLDLQKVEKNEMHLKVRKGDIVEFTKEITMSFEELANQKKISLFFTCVPEHQDAWFDPDKLDKVLFNLLSNAFKFTSKGGSVTVDVAVVNGSLYALPLRDHIKISVSDTGIGIKEDYLQKIFDRFYQIEEQESEIQIGTGIGLHLSKYLIGLHQGQIHVSSKEGEGSRFEVLIPLGSEHLKPEQKLNDSVITRTNTAKEIESNTEISLEEKPVNGNGKKYRILIVEDDYDIRSYIKNELLERYEVLEALDGKEGISMVHKHMPDLIISDVMMPNMDGIQFCRKIKTDVQTSHIPVILLTARTSMENRIEGLETGADSYIPKPFNPKHLLIRIEKLIELRQNLINKFSKTVSFEAKEMALTSADERFLQKAMNLVKENISNPELNIEDMGTELGMSRVHLYRKLKAMTNQTPSEFVRTIRLKQAAYLLAQNKLNISEVAYSVGFSSHQYFTNCFQNYFNMSPTEYCQKAKKESEVQ